MANQEIQNNMAGMDTARLEEFKTVFQFGYNYLSEGNNFKTLKKHATDQNGAEALTTYIVNLINGVVKKFGITDAEILFYAATSLLSDATDRLRESGVKVTDEELTNAISGGIEGVLTNNPEVVDDASKNPNLAKHIPDEVKVGEQPQPQPNLLDPAQQPAQQEALNNGV